LEIKQRAQRGMAFLILTYTFVMAAKKWAKKWDSDFGQKYDIHILVKNAIFLSSFSIVA